jgi:hypothetical protein
MEQKRQEMIRELREFKHQKTTKLKKCELCNRDQKFTTARFYQHLLVGHFKQVREEIKDYTFPHKCDICNISMKNFQDALDHVIEKHDVLEELYAIELTKLGKKGTKIVPDPDYKPINSAPIQGNDLDFTIGDDFSEDIPEGRQGLFDTPISFQIKWPEFQKNVEKEIVDVEYEPRSVLNRLDDNNGSQVNGANSSWNSVNSVIDKTNETEDKYQRFLKKRNPDPEDVRKKTSDSEHLVQPSKMNKDDNNGNKKKDNTETMKPLKGFLLYLEENCQKVSPDENMSVMEVHYGIACDVCEMNHIKGERFKCLICPDYDLCGNCKVKGYRVLPCNAGHEMERKLAPRVDEIREHFFELWKKNE